MRKFGKPSVDAKPSTAGGSQEWPQRCLGEPRRPLELVGGESSGWSIGAAANLGSAPVEPGSELAGGKSASAGSSEAAGCGAQDEAGAQLVGDGAAGTVTDVAHDLIDHGEFQHVGGHAELRRHLASQVGVGWPGEVDDEKGDEHGKDGDAEDDAEEVFCHGAVVVAFGAVMVTVP